MISRVQQRQDIVLSLLSRRTSTAIGTKAAAVSLRRALNAIYVDVAHLFGNVVGYDL